MKYRPYKEISRAGFLDYPQPSPTLGHGLILSFTPTCFSFPQPPSSAGSCPWTRRLLSITKHLVHPTQHSNRWLHNNYCQPPATSQAAELKLRPRDIRKAKGCLLNASGRAQASRINDRSEFYSMRLWKQESSASCCETPWLETPVADLLCTHYIHYTGEKIFAELVLSPYGLII